MGELHIRLFELEWSGSRVHLAGQLSFDVPALHRQYYLPIPVGSGLNKGTIVLKIITPDESLRQ